MKTSFVALALQAAVLSLLAGCGGESPEPAASAPASAEPDACTLLTAAEITEITGRTPDASERANPGLNNCQWPSPGSPVPLVYVGLSYQNVATWEEYRQEMIDNGMGDPDEEGERIAIGRFSHFMPDSAMIQVYTEHDYLIVLRVRGGDKGQLIELASRAAARVR